MRNITRNFYLAIFTLLIHYSIEGRNTAKNRKKEHKPQIAQTAIPQHIDVRKIAITNMKRWDGFGANVQQIIAAALYAEARNYDFFYQPFEILGHNYTGQPDDPDYLAKQEKLINCIGNFPLISEAIEKGYQVKTDQYHIFLDQNAALCKDSLALKKIKLAFRANKNREAYFNPSYLNIAIHIRRPNPHDSRIYGTDVPNSIYVETIEKMRTIYAEKNPLFHIYSQGDINSFMEFESPDTVLHIDESPEDTYTSLVLADVLVTGRSSFSYTAGYLSDGIVYYISYMHAPLPHWISIEKFLGKIVGGVQVGN